MQKITMRFYGGAAESKIVIRDQSENKTNKNDWEAWIKRCLTLTGLGKNEFIKKKIDK